MIFVMRHFRERYFSFCVRVRKDRYGKQRLLRVIWPPLEKKESRAIYFPRLNDTNTVVFYDEVPAAAGASVHVQSRKQRGERIRLQMLALHRVLSGLSELITYQDKYKLSRGDPLLAGGSKADNIASFSAWWHFALKTAWNQCRLIDVAV